jgi:hypothetical protein
MKSSLIALFGAAALAIPAMADPAAPSQQNPAHGQAIQDAAKPGETAMQKSLAPLHLTPAVEKAFEHDLRQEGLKAWVPPQPGKFIG